MTSELTKQAYPFLYQGEFKLNETQLEYMKFYADRSKEISCKSFKSIEEAKLFVSNRVIEPKSCFETATNAALYMENTTYVEGYLFFMGIPIEHAWNKYTNPNTGEDIYFDLVQEVALKVDVEETQYLEILELSTEELRDFILVSGMYMSMASVWYRVNKKNEPLENIRNVYN